MPTGRAEPPRAPRLRTLAALILGFALLGPLLVACSDDEPPGPIEATLEQTAQSIDSVLKRRARALLDDDERLFARTVSRPLRRSQNVYFANVQQLPVETLRYRVVPGSVERTADGRSYWAEIETRLQLDRYDAQPVRTHDRWRFTLDEHGRRLSLSAVDDPDWEAEHTGNVQPWDVGAIRVEDRYDVLGIFDAGTVGDAERVLDSVGEGRYDVASVLPEPRGDAADLGTVVYVLSDSSVIDELSGRAVGDTERADGLTIAIAADTDSAEAGIASYRMVLNPRVLDQDAMALDRLVRHELTHVLLGDRGRAGPLWITEGTAEYVSVQRLDPAERRLPATALTVGVDATRLPNGDDFAGSDAEAWYAVSWWVCEYLARTFGEPLLWVLLDDLGAGRPQDTVLAERVGLTEEQLVQRGVALMSSTYR